METVPRLPMISFHIKTSPEHVSFGPKLKQYIREFYNEDPESYNNEIHQLDSLRAMAIRPTVDMTGCLLLKKYYCQLHFLQSRFPMGINGAAAVTFTWRDTYANMVCSLASIRFEVMSILYNIGSIHTQMGAETGRTTADGMKMACTHFQCAAWAYEHIKNSYPQPSGVDLAPELMTFMNQLCLAQAQECILEKSMLDNRKPAIVAKVAKQVVNYYTQARASLSHGGNEDGTVSDTVGAKIYKSWRRYAKFKKAYYSAIVYLYQGLAAEEQRKMGERVAFYNAALTALNDARAIYTNARGSIMSRTSERAATETALTYTNNEIEKKRKVAMNENQFIYHEEVPEKDTLPTVKGASLVKGISFNVKDPEVSGPDIFARLVPMKVHEASSIYSEEKAKLMRSIGAKIEEKDQQLNTYLASLKLEHMSLWDPTEQSSEGEQLPLPEELVERCAALNAKQNIIQDLTDIMDKLTNTSQDVEMLFKEIQKLLVEEEAKEKQYQDTVGKRPPSIVATDLTREAKKYEEAHNKALESNQALHKAITMHVKNLKILAQPLADLAAQIPSPIPSLASNSEEKGTDDQSGSMLEKMHIKELKRILGKVDQMRSQRNDLHTKLKESVAQDDLTRFLVTAIPDSGPLDRIFAEQLKKHQAVISLIEQNLAAQDNILAALTDAYAKTAEMRKSIEETLKRREFMISSLIASYDAYEDLLAKSSKGLEFYRKLEINVSKLLQRVKSTCKVQDEEREQILAQDKNSADKTDTVLPQEQKRGQTGSGLKLKDYLNSRTENPALQTQYYNAYKGHVSSVQINDTTKNPLDKNVVQSPGTVPISEVPSSSMNATQQYYPGMYTDYRTNSPYSYGTQTYTDNPNINTLDKGYLQTTNTDNLSVYQQANMSQGTLNKSLHYSTGSYVTHEQGFPKSEGQDQYSLPSQPYNLDGGLQSNTYQPAMNYPYDPTRDQTYSTLNQYGTTQVSSSTIVKSEGSEILPQSSMQSIPQPSVPLPAASMDSTITQQPSTTAYGMVPQKQQYMYENQQIPTQNYSLPQTSQHYNAYYNSSNLQTQITPNQTTPEASNFATSQYLPTQISTADQSVYTTSVTMSTTETPVSYASSNLHTSTVAQYTQQQETLDQSKLNYATDKTYTPDYSSQTQINNVPVSYPSTYQSFQHDAGLPYQQPNVLTNTSANYSYGTNTLSDTEMIRSHAKPASVQSYSQSYQYPHQNYSGYMCATYSQDYSQNYPYAQGTVAMTTSYEYPEYAYNAANQVQNYYAPNNLQNSQLDSTATSQASATVNNSIYQQQEMNQSGAQYTNASNNVGVNQTSSSQYPNQVYTSQISTDTYYTTPYGLQMQAQGSTARNENYNYNQTYMQSTNNGTNTTTSPNAVKLTTKSEKSNVDLLSDLDININHAPLVPEVRPLNKKEEDSASDTSEKEKKEEQDKEVNNLENPTTSSMDKIETENLQIVWDTWYNDVQPKKDPLGNPAVLQKFVSDVEKYEKFVDGLLVKTLSGATNLDIKWKEVQNFEERENTKQSSTVALAHSSENRNVDCIPYDTTRVQISSSDVSSYINASHVAEITQWIPTAFIITQAPASDKFDVFWTMVWEQESEVVACLASDAQLSGEIYWTTREDSDLNIGNFTISLKKTTSHASYIQRFLSVRHTKKNLERSIVHMQFFAWPSNGFPNSPGALLAFATDVMTEQALRRCSPKPVVVHCLDGGSLSSLFLLAAATVCHIRAGCGIVDVPLVFKGLAKCRKQVVNKESLLFAYRLVLYHAQDILMKRGILSTRSTFENFEGLKGNKEKTVRKMHPSDDFLHNLGVGVRRSSIEQKGEGQTNLTSNNVNHRTSAQEKSNEVSDPLSELDPLWSIRK